MHFKTNYALLKHCREEKGARCAPGDSPDVKALPGWLGLPTSCPPVVLVPTTPCLPTAHHTTPLLVMGHCCTRKPRLLNHWIIREIPIPLLSLNKCVSKHSLVLNEYTCSPKPANEGILLRTCKQNMVHILTIVPHPGFSFESKEVLFGNIRSTDELQKLEGDYMLHISDMWWYFVSMIRYIEQQYRASNCIFLWCSHESIWSKWQW